MIIGMTEQKAKVIAEEIKAIVAAYKLSDYKYRVKSI